jgi:hypothetical protein
MDKVDIKVDKGESSKVDICKCPLWQAVSFNDRAFRVSNVQPGASKAGHFALHGLVPKWTRSSIFECPLCPHWGLFSQRDFMSILSIFQSPLEICGENFFSPQIFDQAGKWTKWT